MSEGEIKEIIKEFVPEGTEFTIEKSESNTWETTIVVKFSDKEAASEFVRNVGTHSGKSGDFIKRVDFTSEHLENLSSALCHPFVLLSVTFIILF